MPLMSALCVHRIRVEFDAVIEGEAPPSMEFLQLVEDAPQALARLRERVEEVYPDAVRIEITRPKRPRDAQ